MNNFNYPYENKNQALLVSVRNLQKSVHLCCELLPLLPQFKNATNLISILQQITKQP